ncbi:N-acyl homoserine lactonase family protein [Rhodococcus rhodochrous]|uniref:N-acyl homoserine lactonase family protein n=1 Tax=Rhodococcus rhodochrous TaxID=1829 RepID=UPI00037B6A26|nr:N-acyl homoserine lactonase family protein [Rhodococcus rhodochrous]
MTSTSRVAPASTNGLPQSVHAVKFSSVTGTKSGAYLRYAVTGESDGPLTYDFFFCVIHTPVGVILFDTGFDVETGAAHGMPATMPITEGLKALGVDPSEIRTIVLSHMHYDHCGNLELFPDAEIVLQRSEWEFACSPMGGHGQCGHLIKAEDRAQLAKANVEGRLRLVDGDTVIAPGLEVIVLAGHSAGSQGLVIETADGACTVLAGDAGSFYDTWRKDYLLSIVLNVPEMYESFARLRELEESGATVIPAHDSEVVNVFGHSVIADGGAIVPLAQSMVRS